MELKMFTFGIVTLFCIVQSCSGLKCYICNSASNPGCADMTGKNLQLVDCTSKNTASSVVKFLGIKEASSTPSCVKIVGTDGSNTSATVQRLCDLQVMNVDTCSVAHTLATREKQLGDNINLEFCGVCHTDGCNSGNSMQWFSKLIVFGAMVCTVSVKLLV